MITTIFEFFLLWYIFWPVVTIAILFDYYIVNDSQYKNSGYIPPILLGAVIVGLTLNYFPEVKSFVFTFKGALISVISYILIGGLVSFWKWMVVLMDFREKGKTFDFTPYNKRIASYAATSHDADMVRYECKNNLIGHVFGYNSGISTGYIGCKDEKYFLIAKEFPISYWWMYWPLFLLSIVFDPIIRIIKYLVKYFNEIYQRVSKHFSVG